MGGQVLCWMDERYTNIKQPPLSVFKDLINLKSTRTTTFYKPYHNFQQVKAGSESNALARNPDSTHDGSKILQEAATFINRFTRSISTSLDSLACVVRCVQTKITKEDENT